MNLNPIKWWNDRQEAKMAEKPKKVVLTDKSK